jgi:hypothetical protein
MQMKLKEIGGLLLHDTVNLPETSDEFYQRTQRHFKVIDKRGGESQEINQ